MASIETAPKPFVFVLMPFKEEFNDIYRLGIKDVATECGAYCERVDEQIYETPTLARIYNQIAKADIIISDMTERNPNVFYETGYAHALDKRVILLTQKVEDIPFDLKTYPHIIYENRIIKLKEGLSKWIKYMIENPSEKLARVELNLKFFIDSIEIIKENVGKYKIKDTRKNLSVNLGTLQIYELTIDVHNPTQRIYHTGNCSIGIITPSSFPASTNTASTSRIPGDTYIHLLHPIDTIFPGAWRSISIQFGAASGFVRDIFVIRLFTELGYQGFSIEVYAER